MKITCRLSFLLLLGMVSFLQPSSAMMEDEEQNTDLLQTLRGPPLERILSYLTPGAILDLSTTSKHWRRHTAKLWPMALLEIRELEISIRHPNALASECIKSLAALPLGDPWRNKCLRAWADNLSADTIIRINAASALPQDEGTERLLAWARRTNIPVKYALSAATALPLEHPERDEMLRDWAQNVSLHAHDRIRAAAALPRGEPFRENFLRSLARDSSWLLHNRLLAARAMTPGPERDEILQQLNYPRRSMNSRTSPASNNFRKK